MFMFTPAERATIRSQLLERAASDQHITGAAITGSTAAGSEDRWSDVDLAFGVMDAPAVQSTLADWTSYLYETHHAIHHVDVPSGAWIYRVFLLPGTLQVDPAFVPAPEFRALAPSFKLIHGTARESRYMQPPSPEALAGMGWLYAVHARTAIARAQSWQAEYMISGMRGCALAMACVRHGLPAAHARGADRLQDEVLARFAGTLVRCVDANELTRAFHAALDTLLMEIKRVSEDLHLRLDETCRMLKDSLRTG